MAKKKQEKEIVDNTQYIDRDVVEDIEKSFIDYSMSVLTDRAIPSVVDGCKPIHRRILYDMNYTGAHPDKPYKKVTRLVGSIMGRLHAHGSDSIEDALVRFGQDWNIRYPLVEIHGNAGSIDGDPHAAGRYIEGRLTPLALEMTRDINKDVVDFVPNFDGEEVEPVVLPARIPNLLLNGSSGIAVGFTTSIPPHNLSNVVDACVYMIDSGKKYNLDELIKIIKGPDFPTGGLILGYDGINDMYRTGAGKIVMRAKCSIETGSRGKSHIVITEIPYGVNKAKLVEKIADLIKEKKIVGVSELRDESSREGMRIFIEVKKDSDPEKILNRLYKLSDLQCNFSSFVLVLSKGVPKTMKLDEILLEYLEAQQEVIRRRTEYDLKKAQERAHILEGLLIAMDNLDEVIHIIRTSTNDAKERLMKKLKLSEVQAQAILDMRLARLQKLEVEKLKKELAQLLKDIKKFEGILKSPKKQMNIVKTELLEIKEKYGDARRTKIVKNESGEIEVEDLVEEKDCYVTISGKGFINKISDDKAARLQPGTLVSDGTDIITECIKAKTTGHMLCFTDTGKLYRKPVYKLPDLRSDQGTPAKEVFDTLLSEKIVGICYTDAYDKKESVLMVSSDAQIKRVAMNELVSDRKSLVYAKLRDKAYITKVWKDVGNDIMLISSDRMAIRFSPSNIRAMGRNAVGVNAMNISADAEIRSVLEVRDESEVVILSQNGYLKRFTIDDIKKQARSGKGLLLCDNVKANVFGEVKQGCLSAGNNVFADNGKILTKLDAKFLPKDTRTGIGKQKLTNNETLISF